MVTLSIANTQAETFMGDNFSYILTGVVLALLFATYFFNKFKAAKEKNGPDGTTMSAVQEVVNSMFSEERFKVLVEQCVNNALDLLVKGSTKEQFLESIKDNICDSIYNFVETEYPMYTVICSRENIEELADAILDNFGFDEEKIEAAYQEQMGKLNDKTEEE